jgi:Lrp/AsnC family transcriptional regulator, leucine-responsive regulatory protein
VIASITANLNPAYVGLPITVVVTFAIQSDDLALIRPLKRRLKGTPEIVQCFEITGTFDYIAVFVVRTMEHFKKIARKAITDDPNVNKFHTHVVLDTVKTTTSLPI